MPDAPNPLDDPRLTAYALGELDPVEAALVEAEVASRPEARAVVLEIQGAARLLSDHLRAEVAPAPTPGLLRAVDARLAPARPRRRWVRPALAASALGLSATLTWAVLDRSRADREARQLAMSTPPAPPGSLRTSEPQAHFAPMAPAPAPSADQSATFVDAADAKADLGLPAGPGPAPAPKRAMIAQTFRRIAAGNGGFRRWGAVEDPQSSKAKSSRFEASTAVAPEGFSSTEARPISTFPVAPGSDSYARVGDNLDRGVLPPPESVRVEELINALSYAYPEPEGDDPIGCDVEVARCPWDAGHRLVRIGLKGGRELSREVNVALRFQPDRASAYRLFGFDERPATGPAEGDLPRKEASLRPGQNFTVLYEVVPPEGRGATLAAGLSSPPKLLDLEVRCRIGDPATPRSISRSANDSDRPFDQASPDFRLASALAGFGMLLKDSPARGSLTWASVATLAQGAVGADPSGERGRFVELCRKARTLASP